jgi:hypothetical protein
MDYRGRPVFLALLFRLSRKWVICAPHTGHVPLTTSRPAADVFLGFLITRRARQRTQ